MARRPPVGALPAVLVLLTAVQVGFGAGAARAAEPRNGKISTTLTGLPATLAVGGTFELSMTLTSTSPHRVQPGGFALALTNDARTTGTPTDGITVLWQDPANGSWRPSDRVDPGGRWHLLEAPGAVTIQPRGTLTVRARITLNAKAAKGGYRVSSSGVESPRLISVGEDLAGGGLEDDDQQPAQAAFHYGPPTPSPSPSRSGRSSAPATPSARPSTTPTGQAPSPTATPLTAPVTAPAAASGPDPFSLWVAGLLTLGLVAFTVHSILRHRRR
ncbi:hypothetical protein ACIRBX_35550 [Kitasatospora sp. NPDC096147]|uniref:hypothetical protein n=1 Tax=Kitasatospora sp. NPDC096147 TaxID=3364093 RepID=UPI0038124C9B